MKLNRVSTGQNLTINGVPRPILSPALAPAPVPVPAPAPQRISLQQVQVGGGLRVMAGPGDSHISVFDTNVKQAASLGTLGGTDTVAIAELAVGLQFTLSTGAGQDTVRIGAALDDPAPTVDPSPATEFGLKAMMAKIATGSEADEVAMRDSLFARDLFIDLGVGDDALLLVHNQIRGAAVLNGGPGTDRINRDVREVNRAAYWQIYGFEPSSTYGPAKGFSFRSSSIAWSLYEYAAIPGTIFCGWISDKVFHGQRAPATILFMALTLLAVMVYWMNQN